MQEPLVSVCIPAYNNAGYIGETIESILSQTYHNLELIIVDDNSKDRTWEILQEYAGKDIRVKVFRNEQNLGMTGNWNRCLQLCSGDFIKLICADDMIDSHAVEREAKAMEENPGVNLVESDTRLVDINGKKTGAYKRYHASGVVSGKKVAKASLIWKDFFGAPLNNLIRSTALKETGYFDAEFTYILDFDFWVRIACTGDLYIIHELLNSFRVRNDSNTGQLIGRDRKTYVEEHRRLVEKHAGTLGLTRFQIEFSVWFRKMRNIAIGIYLKIVCRRSK